MANYFSKFGKLSIADTNKSVIITNLLKRVGVLNSVKENTLVYYTYDLQDGDTPELVAEKFYGDAERHWIILLLNDIIDPLFDWPLSYFNFTKYIISKYGSTAAAESTIHHYEKIITKTDSSVSGGTSSQIFIIDQYTYANTPISIVNKGSITVETSKQSISVYDYEEQLNESKRSIKLLKKEYASQIEDELTSLMSN